MLAKHSLFHILGTSNLDRQIITFLIENSTATPATFTKATAPPNREALVRRNPRQQDAQDTEDAASVCQSVKHMVPHAAHARDWKCDTNHGR
jgi:hypothetical protein